MARPDNRPYRVAFDGRFEYVRGLDAAHAKLAEYLETTVDYVRQNRRRLAGQIERVTAAEARAVGLGFITWESIEALS